MFALLLREIETQREGYADKGFCSTQASGEFTSVLERCDPADRIEKNSRSN